MATLSAPHARQWLLPRRAPAPGAPGADEALSSVEDGCDVAAWALDPAGGGGAGGASGAGVRRLGAALAAELCDFAGCLRRGGAAAASPRAARLPERVRLALEMRAGRGAEDAPALVELLQLRASSAAAGAAAADGDGRDDTAEVAAACARALELLGPLDDGGGAGGDGDGGGDNDDDEDDLVDAMED